MSGLSQHIRYRTNWNGNVSNLLIKDGSHISLHHPIKDIQCIHEFSHSISQIWAWRLAPLDCQTFEATSTLLSPQMQDNLGQ